MLHGIFLLKEVSHINLLVVEERAIYIFPRQRFLPLLAAKDFWAGTFSRESYFRPLYFTYKGVWRRTFFRRVHISKTLVYDVKFVKYSDAIKGSLYAFADIPTLLVYVPDVVELNLYLRQVATHFHRMSGTLSGLVDYREPSSDITSYDVCHAKDRKTSICNSINTHRRFSSLVGLNPQSSVFYDVGLMRSSSAICPGSVDKKCMRKDLRIIVDDVSDFSVIPIWKYFCGICAYPHSKFGVHVSYGAFLCGTNGENENDCFFYKDSDHGPGCAAKYARSRLRDIEYIQSRVSNYDGLYNKLDSMWHHTEKVFMPSFGRQVIFYNSYDKMLQTIQKSRVTHMCTCMVANVVCDSIECKRRLLSSDVEYAISHNVLKTKECDVLFPDTPSVFFREYSSVCVPPLMYDWIRRYILHRRSGGDDGIFSWVGPSMTCKWEKVGSWYD